MLPNFAKQLPGRTLAKAREARLVDEGGRRGIFLGELVSTRPRHERLGLMTGSAGTSQGQGRAGEEGQGGGRCGFCRDPEGA